MKHCYVHKNIGEARLAIIEQANQIIVEYYDAGYDLTLRQLYYQFIARDIFPADWLVNVRTGKRIKSDRWGNIEQEITSEYSKNHEKNYNRLGDYDRVEHIHHNLTDTKRLAIFSHHTLKGNR